jgi:poly(3-hydroxybutyrate) depolymerase
MTRLVLAIIGVLLALASTIAGQATADTAFDAEYTRLKAGRAYKKEAAGTHVMATAVGGMRLDNVIEVPAEYDPARKWPLRVQLHGGVGRPAPRPGEDGGRPLNSSRIQNAGEINLHPRAWNGVEWWRAAQVDNILNLIDSVKRKYNVDESRVYITGISDGGTGVLFFAMRLVTPWSACLSLNGHPAVLANPQVGADPQLYPTNMANCPMYMVNGGRDELYPAASVSPFVDMLKRAGAPVEFHVYPEAGHNTSWWPEERPVYEKYLAAHPRVAHPASITWETDRTDRYNRMRWLVINQLGKRSSDVALMDVNSVESRGGSRQPVFERARPSGRVDITRKGNAFDAKTRGVQQFTLLLSPDVVDLSKPVQVTVNGRTAFEGAVKKDVATLTKWAARDNDRTMLYGAELMITVP